MRKIEEDWYRRGAEFFKENYDDLADKEEYKECHYLNTAISQFRSRGESIRFFVSCVASFDYLNDLFRGPAHGVEINYYRLEVSLTDLQSWAEKRTIVLKKIDRDPSLIFCCPTLVFAGDHTTIFDPRYLGIRKDNRGSKTVYRDSSKEHFDSKLALAETCLDKKGDKHEPA